MLALLNRWRRPQLTSHQLEQMSHQYPLFARLGQSRRKLAELAETFLRRKTIEGAGDLETDERMLALVALQAALPVLHLGMDLYSGWHSLVLYPDEFRVPYEMTDPAGVVHAGSRDLSGEAWHRGPVILAWSHVLQDASVLQPAGNVVIHEMAHKLDMLNGEVNGMPPLHRDMTPETWSQALSAAYEDLQWHLQQGLEPPIDPYASHSPGEFFAVASELFFAWPEALLNAYPEVYGQLERYYRPGALAA